MVTVIVVDQVVEVVAGLEHLLEPEEQEILLIRHLHKEAMVAAEQHQNPLVVLAAVEVPVLWVQMVQVQRVEMVEQEQRLLLVGRQ